MTAHSVVTARTVCPPDLMAKRLACGVYRTSDDGTLEKRCSHCREYHPSDIRSRLPSTPARLSPAGSRQTTATTW